MDALDAELGFGCTPEESAIFAMEIRARKLAERFHTMKFWGRITGLVADYFIFYALTDVMEAPSKKFYYATSKHLTLKQLPQVTPEMEARAAKMNDRFSGNPAKVYPAPEGEEEPPAEEEGEEGKEAPPKFSEAHRLAYIVAAIEYDCGLVPKGAFKATPIRQITPDPSFTGLSHTDASSLANYLHFRAATSEVRKAALHRAAMVGAGDWMDPASEDAPAGCWTLRVDEAAGKVQLRSFKWPGFFFTHEVATPRYDGVYYGSGQRNDDLSFMM